MGSVTHWIRRLQAGDPEAAQPLWERYFESLVCLARKKLQDTSRRAADEEDVALSAFDSFCRGASGKRFPRLNDRHDLWQLLVVLTARKALHLRRDQCRLKRGGGAVLDEGALAAGPDATAADALEQVLGHEPSPEFAAEVAEECGRLLACLGDADLGSVARWKMEGYTTEEIAERMGYVPRTVERKLELIRRIWTAQGVAP